MEFERVHYRVQKKNRHRSLYINPVHIISPYLDKIRSNIIFPSMPRSSECSLSSRISDQYFICISHLSHMCYMPRPSHLLLFDYPNSICEAYNLGSSSLCGLLQPPTTSFLLRPNILLSTLFHALPLV